MPPPPPRSPPPTRPFLFFLLLSLLFTPTTPHPHPSNPPPPQPNDLSANDLSTIHSLHTLAASHNAAGSYPLALPLLHTALSHSPPLPVSSNLHNTLGVVHKNLHDFPAAYHAFTTAITLDHDETNVHAYYNRGNLLQFYLAPNAGTLDATLSPHVGSTALEIMTAARGDYEVCHTIIKAASPPSTLDLNLFYNHYSLLLKSFNLPAPAAALLEAALQHDPTYLTTLGNLAILQKDRGLYEEAVKHSLMAIEVAPENAQIRHNYGLILQNLQDRAAACAQWSFAISLDPSLFQSHASLGHDRGHAGDLPAARAHYGAAIAAAGSQGMYNEVASLTLQRDTCVVPHIYESLEHVQGVRRAYISALEGVLGQGVTADSKIHDVLTSIGSSSLGYYIIYQGYDDVYVRTLLARCYWKFSSDVLVEMPPVEPARVDDGRIHVGFHGSFFFHHSVGLLMQHVIKNIDRGKYHVTVFLQSYEPELNDEVMQSITRSADVVVKLPNDLAISRTLIRAADLDLLVYTEIGMDGVTYFLPFSKLAKKTALFWGHAVTSGISYGDGVYFNGGDSSGVGGIDYFVSSELFESDRSPTVTRYSETVYEMKGIVTAFETPGRPRVGMTPKDFDLPDQGGWNVYLCPQTLYKLHPRFDVLLAGILGRDERAVIVFPVAQRQEWTDQLMERLIGYCEVEWLERIRFVRRMDFDEYQSLVSFANVVLDPFPVGGGRSSLEIFSTGTPVVMHYERTNILQLTYGMYKVMGVTGGVAYSDEEYIELAVGIGTNRTREGEMRERILENVHKLYENEEVVKEWETFIDYAVANPRPAGGVGVVKVRPEHVDRQHVPIELAGGELAYAIKLVTDDGSGQTLFVRVAAGEDPAGYANQVAAAINAEEVKARWVETVLKNGVDRFQKDVEHTFMIEREGARIKIDVRWGDDLGQLAMFTGLRYGLNDQGIEWLEKELKWRVPKSNSKSWINERRDEVAEKVAPGSVSNGCYLTIAFTTCKRLDLFLQSAASLVRSFGGNLRASGDVCDVLVVDDSSSEEDRAVMVSSFPDFTFIMKEEGERGHAKSMNVIMDSVKTRFLMYVEDDWLVREGVDGVRELAREPMQVLLEDDEILQVLVNDQTNRECAEGTAASLEGCSGKAGWGRKVKGGLEYLEHEFGSLDSAHTFTYWPGFSLNVGVTDLDRVRKWCGGGGVFGESDKRFEQSFSLRCWQGGAKVAHLKGVKVKHLGVISSYVLNGETRPFDAV